MTNKNTLLKMVLEYVEAITNNDLSRLNLSPDLKVTSNGVRSPLGSSDIWGSPRRIPFRQTFVDAETGNGIFFGVITNTTTDHVGFEAKWWRYVVRIKLEQDQIAEIEEIYFDSIFSHYETNPWEITPNPSFRFILPNDEQSGRDDLISIVNCYWDAVERNYDGFSLPFHPDAKRNECGTITTDSKNFPNSARGDFTKVINEGWRWDVVNRRFPVVDIDRGLVVSIADLSTTEKTNPKFMPCIVAEIFKIENGLIKDLFAFFYVGENQSDW